MNHALVAADAGEDAVEQTGGGGQQDARLSAPTFFSVLAAISQMKVAEQPHRRAYPPPRCRAPARHRFAPVRVLQAAWRRRSVDQIACVASCPRAGRAQTRTRRRRRACRRKRASRWREAWTGRSVCRRPPAATAHRRRRSQARLDDHGGIEQRRRSAAPALRPGLACSELAGQENAQQDLARCGPCADATRQGNWHWRLDSDRGHTGTKT